MVLLLSGILGGPSVMFTSTWPWLGGLLPGGKLWFWAPEVVGGVELFTITAPDGGVELLNCVCIDDGSTVGNVISVWLSGQGAPPPNGGGSVQVLDLTLEHSESHWPHPPQALQPPSTGTRGLYRNIWSFYVIQTELTILFHEQPKQCIIHALGLLHKYLL